jgi:predicted exporter
MNYSLAALFRLFVWVAVLVGAGAFVDRHLHVSSDLRLFLPAPVTPAQRLLLDAIGNGPASRLLVIALEGDEPATLAETSRALVEALRDNERFAFVTNGDVALDAVPDDLLPYRYLLSRDDGTRALDRAHLRAALEARAQDLASPGGFVLEPLLPRDPTLTLLALLNDWQPAREPHREFDVWFDAAGKRALLVAETRAAAFDPTAERAALDTLQAKLAALPAANRVTLTATGVGAFSVLMEGRTREATQSLAQWATIGMLLVLLVAYRSLGAIVLSSLPLASAALVGLAAVSAVFGAVHGITLAFGFTLIGVAQDYPIHLLSHRRPGEAPARIAKALWPTLATGVASTSVAYLTFWFSGVTGLEQLACFAVAGLAAAGLTTRFLVPALTAEGARDFGASPLLRRLWSAIAGLPRPRWAVSVIVVLCIAALVVPRHAFWENDLSGLTPVPRDLLERDRELRADLGTADARYLLVAEAPNADAALTKLEALDAPLQALVERGAIAGYTHAARFMPSLAAQQARRAQLPDAETLRADLDAAQAGTAFRAGAFAPFLADVERARTLPPLTLERARATPLEPQIDALLVERGGSDYAALVTFSGVHDAAALQALAREGGVTYLDLRGASEELVALQRTRMLASLAVGGLLLVGIVALALRERRRVLRVLAPMALTTLIIVAALHAAGVSLNLFHLISLILAAGLGLDYALFFEHAADDAAEQGRTLHAILVSATSTFMVFALLALSELPVLRAIGAPVTIGVAANFVLALLLTRPPGARREASAA